MVVFVLVVLVAKPWQEDDGEHEGSKPRAEPNIDFNPHPDIRLGFRPFREGGKVKIFANTFRFVKDGVAMKYSVRPVGLPRVYLRRDGEERSLGSFAYG